MNTGIRRGNIDCDRIVKDIRKGFDDIIWVSASIEGTRLIIQIKENEDAKIDNKTDNKTDIKEDIYPNSDAGTDLVSDCTGTIVRIITRKGIPMVREGTSVNPGDILVSGQFLFLMMQKRSQDMSPVIQMLIFSSRLRFITRILCPENT